MSKSAFNKDTRGTEMKSYEAIETSRRFSMEHPVYARLDGRSFSKFTKGMDRPFDLYMRDAMVETTRYLVDKTHARIGYTQSDEISLFWMQSDDGGGVFFDGKVHKMTSVLASLATAKFVSIAMQLWPERCEKNLPVFDSRVCNLPDLEACADMFLWRVLDARKNSVTMLAHTQFSHKQLTGINTRQRKEMLQEKGMDWNDLPMTLKEGTWLKRITRERTLTAEERAAIPEKYRPPEDMKVMRSSVEELDMPSFLSIENKIDVIMGWDEPKSSHDYSNNRPPNI